MGASPPSLQSQCHPSSPRVVPSRAPVAGVRALPLSTACVHWCAWTGALSTLRDRGQGGLGMGVGVGMMKPFPHWLWSCLPRTGLGGASPGGFRGARHSARGRVRWVRHWGPRYNPPPPTHPVAPPPPRRNSGLWRVCTGGDQHKSAERTPHFTPPPPPVRERLGKDPPSHTYGPPSHNPPKTKRWGGLQSTARGSWITARCTSAVRLQAVCLGCREWSAHWGGGGSVLDPNPCSPEGGGGIRCGRGPLGPPQGMHWKGGGGDPQGAQPVPSHCPPDAKCQLQWHL